MCQSVFAHVSEQKLLIQYANLFVHVQMCLCRLMQTEAYVIMCSEEDFMLLHLFGA